MKLLINNTTDKEIDFEKDLKIVVKEVLKHEGLDENIELSVSFVDEQTIQELNRQYRNVDKVTDVLSFPLYDDLEQLRAEKERFKNSKEKGQDFEKIPFMMGDVVICMDVAKKQAQEFGHSLYREFMYLTAHSLLHLLGYDHIEEEDKKVMRAYEKEIMKNIGVFK